MFQVFNFTPICYFFLKEELDENLVQGILTIVITILGGLFVMHLTYRVVEMKLALMHNLTKSHNFNNEIKLTFNSIEAAMI